LAISLAAPHAAYSQAGQPKPTPKTPAVTPTAKAPAVDEQIAGLQKELLSLKDSIRRLNARFPTSLASLDCDTHKFSELKLDDMFQVVFVSCEGIERYLEGHKVQVSVGNPSSFAFRDVSGKLWSGKTLFEAVDRKTELPSIDSLSPGTWQSVTVIVNPSTPEDMRTVWLELKATRVSAGGRR
jgi:hypothetical protein